MKKTLLIGLLMSGMAFAANIDIASSDMVTVPGSDASWSSAESGASNLLNVNGNATDTVNVLVTDNAYGQYFNGSGMGKINTVNVTIADGASLNMNWNNANGAYSPTNSGSATHSLGLGVGSQLNTPNGYTRIMGSTATIEMAKDSSINASRIAFSGGSNITINMAEGALIHSNNEIALGSVSTTLSICTSITAAEAAQLISTTPVVVSRDLVTADYIQNLNGQNVSVTLTNIEEVENMTYGGMLAKVIPNGSGTVSYYNWSDVTLTGGYLYVNDGAQAVELEIGKAYGYVTMYAEGGAAAKAIGFVACAPEPATATLSLLALAGLVARRRRH